MNASKDLLQKYDLTITEINYKINKISQEVLRMGANKMKYFKKIDTEFVRDEIKKQEMQQRKVLLDYLKGILRTGSLRGGSSFKSKQSINFQNKENKLRKLKSTSSAQDTVKEDRKYFSQNSYLGDEFENTKNQYDQFEVSTVKKMKKTTPKINEKHEYIKRETAISRTPINTSKKFIFPVIEQLDPASQKSIKSDPDKLNEISQTVEKFLDENTGSYTNSSKPQNLSKFQTLTILKAPLLSTSEDMTEEYLPPHIELPIQLEEMVERTWDVYEDMIALEKKLSEKAQIYDKVFDRLQEGAKEMDMKVQEIDQRVSMVKDTCEGNHKKLTAMVGRLGKEVQEMQESVGKIEVDMKLKQKQLKSHSEILEILIEDSKLQILMCESDSKDRNNIGLYGVEQSSKAKPKTSTAVSPIKLDKN